MPHSTIEAPEKLPLYIQQDMVPFPYMVFPVYVNDRDVQTFTEADHYDKLVGVVLRRPTGSLEGQPGDIC
jgi:ATP-dependent Lon protease